MFGYLLCFSAFKKALVVESRYILGEEDFYRTNFKFVEPNSDNLLIFFNVLPLRQ